MVRNARLLTGVAAAGSVLVVVLAGCGQGTGTNEAVNAGGASTQQQPESAQEGTQQPDAGTSSAKPSESGEADPGTSTAKPGDDSCKAADLTLEVGGGDGAAGTVYRTLTFTNTGGRTCTIEGYPGVSYVGGEDGHQIGAAAFREGGDRKPITLNKGESAAAEVGFSQVGNYDPEQCHPEDVRGLRVYPPHDTASVFVEQSGTGCASEDIPGHQLTVKTVEPAG